MRDRVVAERYAEVGELLADNQSEQALDLLFRILEVYPDHLESVCLVAELCEQSGQTEQALVMWRMALEINPRDKTIVDAVQRLSADEDRCGGRDTADQIVESIQNITSTTDSSHTKSTPAPARVSSKIAAIPDNVTHLRSVPGERVQNADRLLEAGRLLLSEGRTHDGIKVLTRVLQLRPTDKECCSLLITAHESLGEHQKADELRQILRR
jgi:tetratricopeptide (TPR) repeat protein